MFTMSSMSTNCPLCNQLSFLLPVELLYHIVLPYSVPMTPEQKIQVVHSKFPSYFDATVFLIEPYKPRDSVFTPTIYQFIGENILNSSAWFYWFNLVRTLQLP